MDSDFFNGLRGEVALDRPLVWALGVRPRVKARFRFPERTVAWAAGVARGIAASRRARDLPEALKSLGRPLDALDILCFTAIPDLEGIMCSSLAVWGERSAAQGDVLVGRNLDYPSTEAIREHSLVKVHARLEGPDGEVLAPARITVGWPGLGGCLTGLTEHGVFGAVHDVYTNEEADPKAPATPRVVAMEELLFGARPSPTAAEDAVALLREQRFVMGGNFMLAWQSKEDRGAAVLELGLDPGLHGGSASLRLPETGQTAIACTNDHRLRDRSDPGCDRYEGLVDGARGAAVGEPRLRALMDDAGMSITLYRCIANLGALSLAVERRTDGGWQPMERFVLAR